MRQIYRDKGLLLIPLPGNTGLNIGRNFTGYWSIREWPWAVYDFADHVTPGGSKSAWADSVLAAGYPCQHVDTRNLDCEDHGGDCPEVVCVDCGESVGA